jgi:general stress protein 26
MASKADDWTKFWDLIKETKYGMFTARHGNGHLHSRPMTTLNGPDDRGGMLWFFMSRSSEPVLDIANEPEVNVAYGNPGMDSYLSVSGTAHLIEDMAAKKKFWSPMSHAWFPDGVTDPDLALVAVTIEHADFWNVSASKAIKVYEMARATMTGTRPNIGEHREVRPR